VTTPVPGSIIYADDVAALTNPGRVIARGRRTSSPTQITAETGVLRIDDVPITGGRLYWIGTGPVGLDVAVAGDTVRISLRYTTNGATPTTASTLLTFAQADVADAGASTSLPVGAFYAPPADQTLSVLLTHSRSAGAGGVVGAVAGTDFPIDLYIVDCGVDPGDTGTDI
jgi:hypothetical protein